MKTFSGAGMKARVPVGDLFLFIHLLRLENLRLGDFEIAIFNRAEETGIVTLVTRRAVLLDLNQQTVAVAIERDIFHGLRVAAFFALHPKLLA
jgi:hypothetical protein